MFWVWGIQALGKPRTENCFFMDIDNILCNKCNSPLSHLSYLKIKTGSMHLKGVCKTCGVRFVHYIPNLPIPIQLSKYLKQKEVTRPQLGLFGLS